MIYYILNQNMKDALHEIYYFVIFKIMVKRDLELSSYLDENILESLFLNIWSRRDRLEEQGSYLYVYKHH